MRNFINTREVLLAHDRLGGRSFIAETAYIGQTIATALDAWKANTSDGITAFTRLDLDTLKGEDVTEDVAQAWLDAQVELSVDDVKKLPDFVRESDAWDRWRDANRDRGHSVSARLERAYSIAAE